MPFWYDSFMTWRSEKEGEEGIRMRGGKKERRNGVREGGRKRGEEGQEGWKNVRFMSHLSKEYFLNI